MQTNYLMDVMNKSINGNSSSNLNEHEARYENKMLKEYRVLLVEDHPVIQKVHYRILKNIGFHVDIAKNGQEALQLCSNDYDVILLDIGLPDIDGVTVCQNIRFQIPHRKMAIIAVTSHGKQIEQKCLNAGINEVVEKPVKEEQLHQTILSWIKKLEIQ